MKPAFASAALLAAMTFAIPAAAGDKTRIVPTIVECNADQGCYTSFTLSREPDIRAMAFSGSAIGCGFGQCRPVKQGGIAIVNASSDGLKICIMISYGDGGVLAFCEPVPARSTMLGDCDDCHEDAARGGVTRARLMSAKPVDQP